MTATVHRISIGDWLRVAALKAVLRVVPGFSCGPEARPAYDRSLYSVPAPRGVAYEPAIVGGVAGWWCRPDGADADAVILYLHGGAYVLGTAAAYRHFAGHVALACGMAAFVPDYALAPERPFPGAFDDALAAYRGMAEVGGAVALVGDSAGGGLCLALAAAIVVHSGEGVRPPFAIAALSPWTDLTLSGDSMTTRSRRDPLLTRDVLAGSSALYLGRCDARDPRSSPLFADFAGIPPVLIHVGTDEVLLDDSVRVAERIAEAGGRVETHVWNGMTHVFPTIIRLRAARRTLQLCGDFLREVRAQRTARTGN